jgi:hypothetical protein
MFSAEMTCCRLKNDFCKKLGGLLFSAKVQNHTGSSEIGRNLHKIQKIPSKAAATKRELICVSQVVYYLCGVFPQLSISRFGSFFTKNPILILQKWKKHFLWYEMKIGLRGVPRHPKGHARVRYGLVLTNYAILMAESSSFKLKVMQPRT